MKLFVNENRKGFSGQLFGVEFVDGVAEVNDHDQVLVEMLEKYHSVSRGKVVAPTKAAVVEEASAEPVAAKPSTKAK